MNTYFSFFTTLLLSTFLVWLYYKIVKGYLIKLSCNLASYFGLTKSYPLSKAVGVLELPLIAISHLLFCLLLARIYNVNILNVLAKTPSILDILYGFFLGIGLMSFSTLLCQFTIAITEKFMINKPETLDSWLTVARGGWMKHHIATIEVIPLFYALCFVFLQIACEETVFRGIFLTKFIIFGKWNGIAISTLLFVVMQKFLMPSRLGAMFPMIGATIMGIVNGVIYSETEIIVPLIVAHITFFIFAVL